MEGLEGKRGSFKMGSLFICSKPVLVGQESDWEKGEGALR